MTAPGNERHPMRIDLPTDQYEALRAEAEAMGLGHYLFVRGVVAAAISLGQSHRLIEHAIKIGAIVPRSPLRPAKEVLHWQPVERAAHWTVEVDGKTFDLVRQGQPTGVHVKPGDGWYLFCPDVLDAPRYFGVRITEVKREADAFILRTVRASQNGGSDEQ